MKRKQSKKKTKRQAENKLDEIQKDSGKIQDKEEMVKQHVNRKWSGHHHKSVSRKHCVHPHCAEWTNTLQHLGGLEMMPPRNQKL